MGAFVNKSLVVYSVLLGARVMAFYRLYFAIQLVFEVSCNPVSSRASSPLAQLYSTSTMEHHHFDQSLMILNSSGNKILSQCTPDEYSKIVAVLEEAILATDLAVYFKLVNETFGQFVL